MSSPSSADAGGAGERAARRVALLGSTGSIGRQTVDVLAAHPDAFRSSRSPPGSNAALLAEQAARLRPRGRRARRRDGAGRPGPPAGHGTRSAAPDALEALATRDDVDLVVVATGGIVSLRPVLAALRAGKVVATANKETLVAGGHLVMPLARDLRGRASRRPTPATRTPARSPGSARSTRSTRRSGSASSARRWPRVARLILTASGGPFLDSTPAELAAVTPAQALRHPTWTMGAKITIDSATLANKGLEVIEAHWLYDVDYDAIEVVIHPQSVVHSAVRFVDGSLKAQLGTPDMRLPIQYALTYPDRRPSPAAPPDLIATGRLDFRAPDEARFPALRIAREAGRLGPARVGRPDRRRRGRGRPLPRRHARLPGIPRLLEAAVERFGDRRPTTPDVDELVALDREVRAAFATDPLRSICVTGFVQSIITIVLFILILGGLVVIHELGHFVTARLANVRVLEFGIGFPPRAKVLRSKGETLYTLNWLPIGGFVKLEGEDGNDADDPRSFAAQRCLTKLLILVAGVAMNVAARVRDLHRHRAGWRRRSSASGSSRSSPARRPPPPASSRATRSSPSTASSYQFITGPTALDRPARPRRRDGRPDHRRRRRRPARRDRSTLRPEAEINAQQGALGISGATKPFEGYFYGEYTQHDLPTAIPIGAQRDRPLVRPHRRRPGQPRRLGRHRPDGAAAGRRARSASPPRSATSSGTAARS